MLKEISIPEIDGSKLKISVIRAKFNEEITDDLLAGCLLALEKLQVKESNLKVFEVPGAFEIPVVAKKLASKVDVVICLGAVIKGGTPHFDYVAGESARGIMDVSVQTGKPIMYGIITCNTMKQAKDRSGDNEENKGWQAAIAGVEMGLLMNDLPKS